MIENFRPGTLERWNVGWEQIEQTNSRAVLLRTSGFGASGPYVDLPGYGTLGEAMSGFAHSTGHPDGPPTFPQMPVADLTAAAHGAIAALYHRDVRQGSGQWLDNNIYEPIMRGLELVLGEYDQLGVVRHRYGNRSHLMATGQRRRLVVRQGIEGLGITTHGLVRRPVYVARARRGDRHRRGAHGRESDPSDGPARCRRRVWPGRGPTRHRACARGRCVGVALTNTQALLPAVGGTSRVVGNNPLAVASPSCLPFPIVLESP
ncbi:MAG: hypothetical protein GEU93_06420 [Propionibacteriales bacterium]|nr:hypothetical protein [Propionibacteriales bacterium]